MRRQSTVWAGVFTAIILISFGILAGTWYAKKAPLAPMAHATVLDVPRAVPAFALEDITHQPFNNQRLLGHWTFLFFGFTHCESICPVTMAQLGAMARMLAEKNDHPLPQVVMITLDPEHDDLARLGQYVKTFYPDFLGARGTLQALQPLVKAMGVAYERVMIANHPGHDTIEHSGAVMLINPQGQLAAFFTPPHHATELAHDYRLLSTLKGL